MSVWLEIELPAEKFYKIVKHITYNMFFGVHRLSTNLRHVILHSIGDALDRHGDLQNFRKAEVFLEQRIKDEDIDPNSLKEILEHKNWNIKLLNKAEKNSSFYFVVDKESGYILDRSVLSE